MTGGVGARRPYDQSREGGGGFGAVQHVPDVPALRRRLRRFGAGAARLRRQRRQLVVQLVVVGSLARRRQRRTYPTSNRLHFLFEIVRHQMSPGRW